MKTERQIDSKLVVVMGNLTRSFHTYFHLLNIYIVGLPARGKSYIVKKLRRYLNWLQYETKVRNGWGYFFLKKKTRKLICKQIT